MFPGSRTIDLATEPPTVSFSYNPEPNPVFPQFFNRPFTIADGVLKMVCSVNQLPPSLDDVHKCFRKLLLRYYTLLF